MPDALRFPVPRQPERTVAKVGRYLVLDTFATGGMASVSFGRMRGPLGVWRTVAIKQMHSQYVRDNQAVAMFVDEARLTSRIVHPNVVPTVDVVHADGALLIVMEYVEGESLARLFSSARRLGQPPSPSVVSAILLGVLAGLHAAHELRDDLDRPLGVVHRDISPQNILVGIDGVARVIDFGIAKAEGRLQELTTELQVKGKARYMAPEQASHQAVDRRADIFSAAVVLWEALAGRLLFDGANIFATLRAVAEDPIELLSSFVGTHLDAVDGVLLMGLARDPERRFPTAREFSEHLERALPPAASTDVARWVSVVAGEAILERATLRARLERESIDVEGMAAPDESAAGVRGDTSPSVDGEATLGMEGHSRAPAKPQDRAPQAARSRRVLVGLSAITLSIAAAVSWAVKEKFSNALPSSTLNQARQNGNATPQTTNSTEAPLAKREPPQEVSPPRQDQQDGSAAEQSYGRTALSANKQPALKRPTNIGKRTSDANPPSVPSSQLEKSLRDCAVPWVFTQQGARIPKPGCFPE